MHNISARAFRARLRGRTALVAVAAASFVAPHIASAQAECGVPTGDRVVCDASGNPYPNGVTYLSPGSLTVATTPDAIVSNGIVLVAANAGGVEQNGRVSSTTTGRAGTSIVGGASGSYTGTGAVSTTGDFAPGISVVSAGPVSVSARDVTTTGNGSGGIVAMGFSTTLNLAGRITTSGTSATVPAGGLGISMTGGASNPGLDPIDLTGPSAILFFDYFFSDNLGFPQDNLNAFIQWTVNGGSVDLVGGVGPGVFGAPPNQPLGRYVDLGGSTSNPGLFETRLAFPTLPGQTFNLTFDYRSTAGDLNTATAMIGNHNFTVSSGLTTFQRFSQDFDIDQIDLVRIAFQGLESDTDNSGIGIDGVLFGPVLPGTRALMGAAPGSILTADAVTAIATAGAATIANSGTIQATGFGSRGIFTTGTTGVTITGRGSVTTGGDLATGIEARSPGAISIQQGSVTTAGMMAPAIRATSTGTGAVSVDVTNVTTTGMGSRGIDAFATSGAVSVAAGTVTTLGTASDAIVAMNNGGGNVAVIATGPVRTGGGSSVAIRSLAGTGASSVTAATVSTAGVNSTAILASGATGATIVTTGPTTTTGTNAPAMMATTVNGIASVTTSGGVATTGAGSVGIVAQSTNGAATVSTTGVTASGAATPAIIVNAGTLGSVTTTGAIASTSGNAITVNAANANVLLGALSSGGANGLVLTVPGTATVINRGTLSGGTGSAILSTGGATTIDNNGVLNGRITLGAGADRLTNSGTFAATADSDFGAGGDSFVNTGLLSVLFGQRAAGTVRLAGLESLSNSGLVDLRNGRSGDTLSLPGVFTGSGASTLGLDVTLGTTPLADRLVAGSVAGTTEVALAIAGGAAVLTAPAVIVQASAASPVDAFVLAAGSTGNGLVRLDIAYDPQAFSYALVGTPTTAVFRALALSEGARELWHRSADAWLGHVRSLRDARGADTGSAIWGQFFGASNTRRNDRDVTVFGQTRREQASYKQDAFGGQFGVDLGQMDADGGIVFGVTGGYLSSEQTFRGSADRISYDVLNAGAYATFVKGPVFVNALGKYDYIDTRVRFPTAGFTARPDLSVYGGQLELGLRFGTDRFFVEPVIGAAYVSRDIDDLEAIDTTGSRIAFRAQDGVRGTAGLRVGSVSTIGGGSTLSVYAGGQAIREFRGRDGIVFSNGGTDLGIRGDRLGTYGRGTVGINIRMPGGVTGFIEGSGDYGDEYRGGAGRGGIRIAL